VATAAAFNSTSFDAALASFKAERPHFPKYW